MTLQQSTHLLCQILDALKDPPAVMPAAPVVVSPCQPCIAVNGVVDPNAFWAVIGDDPRYFNLTGPLDPSVVEVLDPCDPRCLGCPCTDGDCVCACDPTDLADAARTIGSAA